jgi:hypothetical protein
MEWWSNLLGGIVLLVLGYLLRWLQDWWEDRIRAKVRLRSEFAIEGSGRYPDGHAFVATIYNDGAQPVKIEKLGLSWGDPSEGACTIRFWRREDGQDVDSTVIEPKDNAKFALIWPKGFGEKLPKNPEDVRIEAKLRDGGTHSLAGGEDFLDYLKQIEECSEFGESMKEMSGEEGESEWG